MVAVAGAIEERHHLLVEGGTGTGKSLAYLVPAIVSGGVVVVSTATKTLQDQLANSELPFLAAHLGRPVTWAVIKGRQSYLCMAKLTERFGGDLDRQPDPTLFPGADDDLLRIAPWARTHPTGDRDDLEVPVSDTAWFEVSVSGMECPGAASCPQGGACFAEAALSKPAAPTSSSPITTSTASTWRRDGGSSPITTSSSSTRRTNSNRRCRRRSAWTLDRGGSLRSPTTPAV